MTGRRGLHDGQPYPRLVPEWGVTHRAAATLPIPPSDEPFAGHGHMTGAQQDRLARIRDEHDGAGY